MIREIINEVREAIQEAFTCAFHTNSGSFVLFLARGDYDHRFEEDQFAHLDPKPSPYCLDYMLDSYKDETRDKFYIRYLNRRYKNDDFKYQGEDGIDDLCVEMMIYSHVWESEAFLKHLYRLSNIVSGKEFYDWDVSGIKFHGHPLIMETKERFKDACPKLYKIIDASYTGYIRDCFAHSLFNVDEDARIIELYSDRVKNDLNLSRLGFDEFQARFLFTVELCYELSRMFHETRKALIKDWELLSKPIPLPDGKVLSITEAELLHGEPRFRATIYVK